MALPKGESNASNGLGLFNHFYVISECLLLQANHVSDIANKSKLCVDMRSIRNIVLFLTDLALI